MIYDTTTKYWATQTTNKTGVNSDAPEWLGVSALLNRKVLQNVKTYNFRK